MTSLNNLRFYHGTGRKLTVNVTASGQPVELSTYANVSVSIQVANNGALEYSFTPEQKTLSIIAPNELHFSISRQQTHFLFRRDWQLSLLLEETMYPVATLQSDGFATRSESKEKLKTELTIDINSES